MADKLRRTPARLEVMGEAIAGNLIETLDGSYLVEQWDGHFRRVQQQAKALVAAGLLARGDYHTRGQHWTVLPTAAARSWNAASGGEA